MHVLKFSFLVYICDLLIWTNGQSTSTCCTCMTDPSGYPIIKPLIGPKGDKGDGGAKGATGHAGLPGLQGFLGPKGEPGFHGIPGISGHSGRKGDQGEKGDHGRDGLPGLPGHKGSKGGGGMHGFNGPKGLKGQQGIKGEKGASAPVIQGQRHKNYRLNEFIAFGNKSYWFSALPLTWQKARNACIKLGADLVSVESYEEDTFLTVAHIELAKKYSGLWNSFFTSGSHKSTFTSRTGYKWVWVQGSSDTNITYNRYADAQRFATFDRNMKCLVYATKGSLLAIWDKASCDSAHQFVCEKGNAQ